MVKKANLIKIICLLFCWIFLLSFSSACSPKQDPAADFTPTGSESTLSASKDAGSPAISEDRYSDQLGQVKADRPYTIGLTADFDHFTEQIIEAIKAECDLHKAKLLASYVGHDAAEQIDHVKSFVQQKVDAIIVLPADDKNADQILNKAGQTPLIFVNRKPPVSAVNQEAFIYVGSDEKDAGRLQAEYLQKYAARKQLKEIRYFYLQGDNSLSNSRLRYNAFVRTLEKGPIKAVSLGVEEANWSRKQAQNLTQIFLSSQVDVNAIVCGNDKMALGALDALKAAGRTATKEVAILGVDGNKAAQKAIARGEMQFTVYQNATAQGSSAVRAAILLANQSKSVPLMISIPFKGMSLDDLASSE